MAQGIKVLLATTVAAQHFPDNSMIAFLDV